MTQAPATGLPIVEESEAAGTVTAVYEEIKRYNQLPYVPNIVKIFGASPDMLTVFWTKWRAMLTHRTLPDALVAMISYTIATHNECAYCSALNELSCRTLGIDEEMLDNLVKDLGHVSPLRIRAIINFSLRVVANPKGLTRADYDQLRDLGVTDEEILEIVLTAAFCVYLDVLADTLKPEVDTSVAEALHQLR